MGKRKVLNESALKEIRLPEEGELLGRVIKLLGSDQVLVKCTDDITRRGRIRGKLKRRIWIRDNDIVIIAPWDFKQTERGDIFLMSVTNQNQKNIFYLMDLKKIKQLMKF